jgi:hypothetical protein
MTRPPSRVACVLAAAPATLLASALFTAGVAIFFRTVWHSPDSLVYNVPVAAPFAAFLFDRLLPRPSRRWAPALFDLGVLGLALLRVFAPPMPFVSGHTLFTAYAALTARRWPLRMLAAGVLLHVTYVKLFVTGGWISLVAGLGVAGLAALLRGVPGL